VSEGARDGKRREDQRAGQAKHAVSKMVGAKETEGDARLLRKNGPTSTAQQICDRSTQRLLLLGLNAWWDFFVRSTTCGRVRWDRGLGCSSVLFATRIRFSLEHALVVIRRTASSSSGTVHRLRVAIAVRVYLHRTGGRVIIILSREDGWKTATARGLIQDPALLSKNSMVQQHSRRPGCRHSTLGDGDKS
jgi:hypothetical protein